MARDIIVRILGDDSDLSKSLGDAEKKVGGFSNVLKGVGVGIGFGAIGLAKVGVESFIGILADAKRAYLDDEVSQTRLRAALKANVPAWEGNTDAIEKVIDAQTKLGFSDDAQRQSLAELITKTGSVEASQQALASAMDLARLSGDDLSTTTDAIIQGLSGSSRSLKKYGIEVAKGTDLMEILTQIQARAGQQAEEYAETSLGKEEAAQVRVGESMEKLGRIIAQISAVAIPIVADAFEFLVNAISDVWVWLQPVIAALDKRFGPALRVIADVTVKVIKVLGRLIEFFASTFGKAFELAATAIDIVSTAVGNLWSGIQTVFGNIANALATLVAQFQNAAATIANALASMIPNLPGIPGLNLPTGSINFGGGITSTNIGVPIHHAGGVVGGPPGSDQLIMAQAGEQVVPRNGGAAQVININIASFIGSDQDIDRFSEKVALRLRTLGP